MCPIKCLAIFKSIVLQLQEKESIKYPHHKSDLFLRQSYYKKFLDETKATKEKAKIPKDTDPEIYFKEQEGLVN